MNAEYKKFSYCVCILKNSFEKRLMNYRIRDFVYASSSFGSFTLGSNPGQNVHKNLKYVIKMDINKTKMDIKSL